MQSNTSKMPASQSPIPLHAISADTLIKDKKNKLIIFIAYMVYIQVIFLCLIRFGHFSSTVKSSLIIS
jgi:hypothetical protein